MARAIIVCGVLLPCQALAQSNTVHIILFGNNALLSSVADAFQQRVSQSDPSIKFARKDAGFDAIQSAALARESFAAKPKAVLALGTPAIFSALGQHDGNTPLFFAATSDAYRLKFVSNPDPATWQTYDAPKHTYGYVSHFSYIKMANLLRIVHSINRPNEPLVRIGSPVTETESNATLAFDQWKRIFGNSVAFLRGPVSDPSSVSSATRALISKNIQIIQIGPDNTVSGAISAVVGSSSGYDVPVLTSDRESVNRGGTAAMGIDFTTLGNQLGGKAVRVFQSRHTQPAIESYDRQMLYVNMRSARQLLGETGVSKLVSKYRSFKVDVERLN